MPLFRELSTKYETRIWLNNPELGLIDTLLEAHPELLEYVREDITRGQKSSNFGRGDMPSVEQIFRAAIYKEIAGEAVSNDQKLFSIYEPHTDIIVKGSLRRIVLRQAKPATV